VARWNCGASACGVGMSRKLYCRTPRTAVLDVVVIVQTTNRRQEVAVKRTMLS